MRSHARLTPIAVALFALLSACGKKQEPAPPPAPTPAPTNDDAAARARADSLARARQDSIARAQAEAERQRAAAVAATVGVLKTPIYFAYDSDVLSDTARQALDAKIVILNANPSVKVRLEGNTDERGSDEYNLALGQRRAAAGKRYLTQHGIADDRIDIISFGEERPVVEGHDEAAWAKNRRDDTSITAGESTITPTMTR
ncbi:MAG TPA: peptidoglycan-associated lipoprotein Pal [Gemmatimonadaceae bacterium]|nr:peptidoglycan-associated lipoprotein Pal [Gemmatimonadaceae bacterium]